MCYVRVGVARSLRARYVRMRRAQARRARVRCARKPRLQTELLGKLLFHLVLIKNIGEDDLLALWNISDKILEVASNNEEVSCARSNVGNG